MRRLTDTLWRAITLALKFRNLEASQWERAFDTSYRVHCHRATAQAPLSIIP